MPAIRDNPGVLRYSGMNFDRHTRGFMLRTAERTRFDPGETKFVDVRGYIQMPENVCGMLTATRNAGLGGLMVHPQMIAHAGIGSINVVVTNLMPSRRSIDRGFPLASLVIIHVASLAGLPEAPLNEEEDRSDDEGLTDEEGRGGEAYESSDSDSDATIELHHDSGISDIEINVESD